MPKPTSPPRYDAAIVGAGVAGLAAALTLRRHRRSVVVFHGGPPSNAWATAVHSVLGLRGVSGSALHEAACQQVREVGGEIVAAPVRAIERDACGFTLETSAGEGWSTGHLLLATGLRHQYPDIANFFDFYGRTVFHCPHCDGYEVRGQPIAVVDWHPHALPFVLGLTVWTRDITLITDGRSPELSADDRAQLAAHGVPILTRTVARFEGADGKLAALRFVDGSALPVRAAVFNIGFEVENCLARALGCDLLEGGCVQADPHGRTSVANVWAAGDMIGREQMVSVAQAEGVLAAIDIHRALPLPSGEPTPS